MSPLKTTFAKNALIGALMAVSPLALKAQTSAQVFNTNKDSITHVMNTAVVNDNTDPETKEWESGIVEDSHDAAEEYSNNYRGIGISIYTGKLGVENAIALGEKAQKAYAEKYGVESRYFVQVLDKNHAGNGTVFFVHGVPSAMAKNNESFKIQFHAAMGIHKTRNQTKFDGYGKKSLLDEETRALLMTPTSELR